jgi:site-specific DNA-cytosine methylase
MPTNLWTRGPHNSHHLRLTKEIGAGVHWAITGPSGYIARVMGAELPGVFDSVPAAQEAAEARLTAVLREALGRVEGAE